MWNRYWPMGIPTKEFPFNILFLFLSQEQTSFLEVCPLLVLQVQMVLLLKHYLALNFFGEVQRSTQSLLILLVGGHNLPGTLSHPMGKSMGFHSPAMVLSLAHLKVTAIFIIMLVLLLLVYLLRGTMVFIRNLLLRNF